MKKKRKKQTRKTAFGRFLDFHRRRMVNVAKMRGYAEKTDGS
jgi:hypothetical protein